MGVALLVASMGAGSAAAVGCTGVIGDSQDGAGGGSNDPAKLKDALVDSTRFPRLTHDQWENTVRDLLKLADRPGLSSSFTTDPPGSTFGNDGALLQVTPGLWGDYQKAAEALADQITADSTKLAKVVGDASGDGDAKISDWVRKFGKHAFRRPLTDEEVTNYVTLFKQGLDVTTLTDPFAAGVSVVMQAMLQSPSFVYRVEIGKTESDGTLGLTNYEMASRLSYSIWNSMPDDQLFADAEAGTLDTPEGVAGVAKRMLDDPRAEPTIADFHARLLQFDHMADLAKDATLYPEFKPAMSAMFRTEAEKFVHEAMVVRNGGIGELLTANYTFVNETTAPLYGLTGITGSDFQKVTLDKTRAGFLTQIGFLAANASSRETDPIHRGVFINLRIICAPLPNPPAKIPPLPSDPSGTKTMRQRIEDHTKVEPCHSCHGVMINPIGFAYEEFDALGKFRTTDHDQPVNAADTYNFEDGPQSYGNAVDLAKILAARPQVHRCYTGNWLEYAFGRQKAEGDTALIDAVSKKSLAGASTKEIIMQLVQARAFSHRPAPVGGQ